ncbi:MAG: nuclear transport factor 2 family protein [Candidatus Krumholzibacteriota bacterium]|nr:nuclear transport factor 2 family protein [Candidatus Krumholzibacteriota bacterium]
MKSLSREDIKVIMEKWLKAWDEHDLDGVVEPFAEEIVFEHWTGSTVRGKKELIAAWRTWFDGHGGFRFIKEDIFIDETDQKVLFRWIYEGPTFGRRHQGKKEVRRGVDILYFREGKIIEKSAYSKTTIEIDGKRSV